MRFIDVDPRLSEFSRDELSDTNLAVVWKIEDLQKHVMALSQTASMQRMFEKEILEWETKIENMRTFSAQLMNAIARKDKQEKVASN